LTTTSDLFALAPAFILRIREAGLKTQNYDKGLDRFIRHFKDDEGSAATIAVVEGKQQDRGYAVFFEQNNRRCLVLDTMYGYMTEEVFWTAMTKWVNFRPQPDHPRKDPGSFSIPLRVPTF
jgi:hypothetical protein